MNYGVNGDNNQDNWCIIPDNIFCEQNNGATILGNIVSDHDNGVSDHDNGVSDHDNIEINRIDSLLDFCSVERTREDIQRYVGIKHRWYFLQKILKPLLDAGKLRLTIPDKPSSKHQKYIKGTVE